MPSSSDTLDNIEWLYKQDGLVYGPISGKVLLEKIHSGELKAATQASQDGGPFRELGEVPSLLGELARADARLRVESEALGQERRRRRRRILRWGGGLGGAALMAGCAIGVVVWIEGTGWFGPDLGALQIEASLPTIRLQVVSEREEEFFEYEDEAPAAKRTVAKATRQRQANAHAASGASKGSAADPDGLTTHHSYDSSAIQAVIRTEQHRLHPCLRDEVARAPTFRGEVPFTFVIGNDGRVVKLWMDRRDLQGGPLQDCLLENIGKWRFPGFEGERPSVSHAFRVGG